MSAVNAREMAMSISRVVNLAALFMCIGLAGCSNHEASPIVFSIEQLGAETATRSDSELDYRTAVSITGVSAPYAAGRLLSVPGDDAPDVLSVPVATTCSRIVETKYDSSATEAQIRALAVSIESIRESLIKKAVAESKLQVLAAARATYDKASAAGTLNRDPLIKTFSSVLGVANLDKATLDGEEAKLKKEISSEQAAIAAGSNKIVSLADQSNIYIFRWARAESEEGGGSIGSIFSGGSRRSDNKSGYLIAASLRASSLEYGDDLVIKLMRHKKAATGSDAVLEDTYITNYTLGARYHYFSEDRDISSAVQAALKLSAEELDEIFGGGFTQFIQAQSLAVEMAISSSVAIGARGLSAAPKRTVYPFRMWGDLAFAASGDAERERNNGYTTFYSTRSNIAQFKLSDSAGISGRSQYQCMQNVPRQGAIFSVPISKIKYEFCSPVGWDTEVGNKALKEQNSGYWLPDTNACIEFDKPTP